MADGAYDDDPVSQAVLGWQPDAKVIVPPHKTAVCSPAGDSQLDNPIQVIDQNGRIAWQKKPAMACVIMPNWPCKESSVFLATR
jgi:hypothetical protein